jgi:hypothetical protein
MPRRVPCSVQEFLTHTYVIFIDPKRRAMIARLALTLNRDSDGVAAPGPRDLDTINLVENALAERRPVMGSRCRSKSK